MTRTEVTELRKLIADVRSTFRLLAGISDKMLEDRGLTASLRAILEFLSLNGPSPVPTIASAKSMTRQSVQALVDRLISLGLVETIRNPSHKRSVLVTMTTSGQEVFAAILEEENTLLSLIGDDWRAGLLQQASETLLEFQSRLRKAGRWRDNRVLTLEDNEAGKKSGKGEP